MPKSKDGSDREFEVVVIFEMIVRAICQNISKSGALIYIEINISIENNSFLSGMTLIKLSLFALNTYHP